MSLTKVTYSMIDGAPINVRDYGAVGDGVADDTAAIQAAFAALTNNSVLCFPAGNYVVNATNANVTATGDTKNNTVILLSNKTNIRITGNGRVTFKSSASTTRNFLITAKDCDGVAIDNLNIFGELDLKENVPNSEVGVGYGIYFYNSTNCSLTNSYLYGLIIPFEVTGQGLSPATTSSVSSRVIIANNHFENFEQNSTFGAGASELIINSNTFRNCHVATKISQAPLNNVTSVGAAGRIIWSNNTVAWDSSFEFAEVWFDLGKSQVPYGLQIQSHNHNIVATGNVIDMSNCRALTLPAITEPSGIQAFTSDASVALLDNFQPTRLVVSNNTVIAYPTNAQDAIRITPYYRDVEITNNTCVGRIRVSGTGGNDALDYGLWKISGNTIRNYGSARAAQLLVTNGNFSELVIDGNVLLGDSAVTVLGDQETIFLTAFVAASLTIANNTARNGRIGNYTAARFTAVQIEVANNLVKGVDIATTNASKVNVVGNSAITDGVAYKIDLDATTKANAVTKFSGNSCSPVALLKTATAVNLNGGTVYLDGNSFEANAATSFVLDASVFIQSGSYFGQGVPTQNALYGVTYVNYSTGAGNATYLKLDATGNTGWKEIATL